MFFAGELRWITLHTAAQAQKSNATPLRLVKKFCITLTKVLDNQHSRNARYTPFFAGLHTHESEKTGE